MLHVYRTVEAILSPPSDEQLWSKFRQGDQDALSEIYERHSKKLYAYGRKFTSDSDVVKDCLHDLFSDFLEKPASVSETGSVKMYLMKALRHRLLSYHKKYTYASLDMLYELSLAPSIEDQIIENELIEWQIISTRHAIARLTKRQQEIIFLKYYYSFDNRAIAEIMVLNYQAVCNLLYRTLKTIRILLSERLIQAVALFFTLSGQQFSIIFTTGSSLNYLCQPIIKYCLGCMIYQQSCL
ncbi:RNA polymerase sigma factor [Fibrella forsythiae]|uniref:Sigma-70 family RNA polymerase sigma factor n=1 Tax=Fibrella forsythiae TaxID=2817061 RepID=A0ABS3JCJ7_9BACT|nr:sigma-70 family RNA polymerase sigma factor [Fibrella forsythiae]MBO0947734.1 sigma-70 family RNA polymerase sigma factor [Fibrella forsythiae]